MVKNNYLTLRLSVRDRRTVTNVVHLHRSLDPELRSDTVSTIVRRALQLYETYLEEYPNEIRSALTSYRHTGP